MVWSYLFGHLDSVKWITLGKIGKKIIKTKIKYEIYLRNYSEDPNTVLVHNNFRTEFKC